MIYEARQTLCDYFEGRNPSKRDNTSHTPQAMNMAKSFYLKDVEVEYINNKYDALNDVDALVIVTEWKEFQSPDFMEIAARMKGNDIFDGRNIYKAPPVKSHGLNYYQIGVRK